MTWLKACTVGAFSYVTWRTVEIALDRAASLSPLFLPLFMIASLVIIAVYCFLIVRKPRIRARRHKNRKKQGCPKGAPRPW